MFVERVKKERKIMANAREREFPEEQEYEIVSDETEMSVQDKKKTPSFLRSQLPVVTQTVICLLCVGFALIAKTIGGTFYAETAAWYFDHYNNSIYTGTKTSDPIFTDKTSITETSLTAASVSETDIDFSLPLKTGIITSGYGEREYNGKTQFHKGIDIGADKNSEICAVKSGTVITAENDSSYGNYIVIQHDDNSRTLYAHCEKLLVKKGDVTAAGSVIALVGETGDADGAHLHLEYITNGENADPAPLLKGAYT